MEIKCNNRSLGFHPDFTFVVEDGVRVGFPLPPFKGGLQSLEVCSCVHGLVCGHQKGGQDPENHGVGAGGCTEVPCWPLLVTFWPAGVSLGIAPGPGMN